MFGWKELQLERTKPFVVKPVMLPPSVKLRAGLPVPVATPVPVPVATPVRVPVTPTNRIKPVVIKLLVTGLLVLEKSNIDFFASRQLS